MAAEWHKEPETEKIILGYSGLLIIIIGIVYYLTLLPGVGFFGDTAKWQFLGKILGIPHPTGYPLYLILNHIFVTIFPFGSLAFKANLLSAIFTIATALVFFRLLLIMRIDEDIAFFVTLAMAFTYTIWFQSVVAEVYSLNLLLTTLVIYFLAAWHYSRADKYFYYGIFTYAMSFGNHLTMITFLPAIVYFIWLTDKKAFLDKRKVLAVFLFILIGAGQYGYLFWRSLVIVPHQTFWEHRITDFNSFRTMVTGGGFKGAMFSMPLTTVITEKVPEFVTILFREYLILVPAGLFGICRFTSGVNAFLLLAIGGNLFYSLNYNIPDIHVYYIPTLMIFGIYTAAGIQKMFQRLFQSYGWLTKVFAVIPLMLLLVNFPVIDNRIERADYRQYTMGILSSIKDRAVVVSPGDYSIDMFMQYYLLGEEVQRDRNIYLVPYNPEVLQQYIIEDKPIELGFQGISVPPGLTVYSINRDQNQDFTGLGLKVSNIDNSIAIISDQ